jgi:hypothetical protein
MHRTPLKYQWGVIKNELGQKYVTSIAYGKIAKFMVRF